MVAFSYCAPEFSAGKRAALGLGLVLALSGAAYAGPSVTMQWFSEVSGTQDFNLLEISDQSYDDNGLLVLEGGISTTPWDLEWDVRTSEHGQDTARGGLDGTAIVTANLAVTNFSASAQVFWALVTVNLDDPLIAPTNMEGRVSGSVTDLLDQNGSASFTNPTAGPQAGAPIYSALIDGTSVRTMWDTFTLNAAGPPGASNADATTFGMVVPEVGPSATNTISVWLRVEVSAFDQANLIGTFEISEIPAPAAMPLLGLFGLTAVRRRRRGS